jgi:carbon monoxide dehydrogenase subunit G
MAVRPDSPTERRRADAAVPPGHLVERRVFVQAPPRVVWATLHDPLATAALFPELRLGPAAPSWPAAATTRTARAQVGLLREPAMVESLEARPEAVFRLRVTASGFDSEWTWRMEPVAGGTRVVHAATFEPIDRWAGILVRLGRRSLAVRVEAHLRALKERAERAAAIRD